MTKEAIGGLNGFESGQCFINRLAVRLVGIAAGVAYGPLGATHHAIDDVAITRAIPNMTVIHPADAVETKRVIKASAKGLLIEQGLF